MKEKHRELLERGETTDDAGTDAPRMMYKDEFGVTAFTNDPKEIEHLLRERKQKLRFTAEKNQSENTDPKKAA